METLSKLAYTTTIYVAFGVPGGGIRCNIYIVFGVINCLLAWSFIESNSNNMDLYSRELYKKSSSSTLAAITATACSLFAYVCMLTALITYHSADETSRMKRRSRKIERLILRRQKELEFLSEDHDSVDDYGYSYVKRIRQYAPEGDPQQLHPDQDNEETFYDSESELVAQIRLPESFLKNIPKPVYKYTKTFNASLQEDSSGLIAASDGTPGSLFWYYLSLICLIDFLCCLCAISVDLLRPDRNTKIITIVTFVILITALLDLTMEVVGKWKHLSDDYKGFSLTQGGGSFKGIQFLGFLMYLLCLCGVVFLIALPSVHLPISSFCGGLGLASEALIITSLFLYKLDHVRDYQGDENKVNSTAFDFDSGTEGSYSNAGNDRSVRYYAKKSRYCSRVGDFGLRVVILALRAVKNNFHLINTAGSILINSVSLLLSKISRTLIKSKSQNRYFKSKQTDSRLKEQSVRQRGYVVEASAIRAKAKRRYITQPLPRSRSIRRAHESDYEKDSDYQTVRSLSGVKREIQQRCRVSPVSIRRVHSYSNRCKSESDSEYSDRVSDYKTVQSYHSNASRRDYRPHTDSSTTIDSHDPQPYRGSDRNIDITDRRDDYVDKLRSKKTDSEFIKDTDDLELEEAIRDMNEIELQDAIKGLEKAFVRLDDDAEVAGKPKSVKIQRMTNCSSGDETDVPSIYDPVHYSESDVESGSIPDTNMKIDTDVEYEYGIDHSSDYDAIDDEEMASEIENEQVEYDATGDEEEGSEIESDQIEEVNDEDESIVYKHKEFCSHCDHENNNNPGDSHSIQSGKSESEVEDEDDGWDNESEPEDSLPDIESSEVECFEDSEEEAPSSIGGDSDVENGKLSKGSDDLDFEHGSDGLGSCGMSVGSGVEVSSQCLDDTSVGSNDAVGGTDIDDNVIVTNEEVTDAEYEKSQEVKNNVTADKDKIHTKQEKRTTTSIRRKKKQDQDENKNCDLETSTRIRHSKRDVVKDASGNLKSSSHHVTTEKEKDGKLLKKYTKTTVTRTRKKIKMRKKE